MGHNFNGRAAQQQRRFAKRAQNVDANHFFNLHTDSRMLGLVEAQLPEHRERQFPSTLTLAMFLGQIMSADGSCQNAVNEAIVARLLAGMNPGSVSTSGYCQSRANVCRRRWSVCWRDKAAPCWVSSPPLVLVWQLTAYLSDQPFFIHYIQLLIPYVSAIRVSPGNMLP